MTELILTLSTGIAAFVATNIDDIFILVFLFSQTGKLLRRRHIILGQYLGFSFLILASTLGVFSNYLIPQECIRLLGLVPIGIWFYYLIKDRDNDDTGDTIEDKFSVDEFSKTKSFYSSLISPQIFSIAAITIANGSDNISIYLPLFASAKFPHFLIIVAIFLILVGVWCAIAERLTQLPAIALLMSSYSETLVPCVLIGLGMFIVKESWSLALFTAGISYLLLTFFWTKESS
jgi:cadmium resistance protein CadD (predicted permease)